MSKTLWKQTRKINQTGVKFLFFFNMLHAIFLTLLSFFVIKKWVQSKPCKDKKTKHAINQSQHARDGTLLRRKAALKFKNFHNTKMNPSKKVNLCNPLMTSHVRHFPQNQIKDSVMSSFSLSFPSFRHFFPLSLLLDFR